MATNDGVLIDSIIESMDIPGDIGSKFDFFSTSELLKNYDLSDDEINDGLIDGSDDGGFDGVFSFVNDKLITDPSMIDGNNAFSYKVFLISCKHSDKYKMSLITDMESTLSELLNFELEESEIKSTYNDEIIRKFKCIKEIYYKTAPYLSEFRINIIYASRSNADRISQNIKSKSESVINKVNNLFSNVEVNFEFVGANELLTMHRKKKKMISNLKFQEHFTSDDSYIGLCTIKDYFDFITDEEKNIKRYYLDSNVRDYMGLNSVNSSIVETLGNEKSPDFWFLNNGITILSDKVTMTGKTAQISNAQIVNGLQTTETIYNYYKNEPSFEDDRKVLIKIIQTDDKAIRDSIISSTNNQTSVENYSLKATDPVQRNIEEYLYKYDIYYERRVNHYKNLGMPSERIISPLMLAYGFVATVLKLPDKAVRLKSKFMKEQSQYDIIFSKDTPLEYWRKISLLLFKVDEVIKEKSSRLRKADKLMKKMRCIVLFVSLAKYFNKFNYTVDEISNVDVCEISNELIETTYEELMSNFNYKEMHKKQIVGDVLLYIESKYNICNLEEIKDMPDLITNGRHKFITEENINSVMELLPEQPWPKKIHLEISKQLNMSPNDVSHIINILITRKKVFYQKDGIVYDYDGNILKKREGD